MKSENKIKSTVNDLDTEELPKSIEQWYKCATNINRHWRENKRDEERLRRRQGQRGSVVRHGSH